MTKRNPKGTTKADATMEVAEGEVIQASPPPLPALVAGTGSPALRATPLAHEPVEKPSLVGRSFSYVALPFVRAALRLVKPIESRLERLQAQLEISAARPAGDTESDDGMATGRA